MNDGGYKSRNGAKDAPVIRNKEDGMHLGDDFPILCETCLGPNPYVRMVKLPYGQKLCKISNAPYQAFRWKAGPGGRYKETIISYVVAKERNICQTCLNDLQFGLPVGVRDKILSQNQQNNQIALPESQVGTSYYYNQQAQLKDEDASNGTGSGFAQNIQNLAATRQLERFSKGLQAAEARSRTAFRNLPKLCSFWVAGSCIRVTKKNCPFRPCCGTYLFPEIAGSDKEISDKLIADLKEKGPAAIQKTLDNSIRILLKNAQKGNRDEAIKKRVTGEDALTNKYLGRMKTMNLELAPSEDPTITTLWVGNLDAEGSITEQDLYDAFFPSGPVAGIHILQNARCAFVEMGSREAAEEAAKQLHGALIVKGYVLSLNWARPRPTVDSAANSTAADVAGGDGAELVMLAPPGLEHAPSQSYSVDRPPLPPGRPPTSAEQAADSDMRPAKRQATEDRGSVPPSPDTPPALYYSESAPLPPTGPEQSFYSHGPIRTDTRVAAAGPMYPSMNPMRMGTSFHGGGRGQRGGR